MSADEEASRESVVRIALLVAEGSKYYPAADTAEEALGYFQRAIQLAPPAPKGRTAQEDLDLGDVGFAFWAAWNCLELLDRERPETDALVVEAEIKSPVTAQRIKDALQQSDAQEAAETHIESILEPLHQVEGKSTEEVREAAQRVIEECGQRGQWWAMRDAATSVARAGHRDAAWGLLNAALQVCWKLGRGNTGSIYERMGAVCKSEKRYATAAQQYLLACCETGSGGPTKNAVEQLRICLKKAGLGEGATKIRDDLVTKAKDTPSKTLIEELRLILTDARLSEGPDEESVDPAMR